MAENTKVCARCGVKWSHVLHERVKTNNGDLHNGCLTRADKIIDREFFGGDRKPEEIPEFVTPDMDHKTAKMVLTQGTELPGGGYNAAKVFQNMAAIVAAGEVPA